MVCTILLAGVLLFIAPMSSMAQTIGWDPLSMNFQDIPYGTTETRALTLTNIDSVLPVNIVSVEWTYLDFYTLPGGGTQPAFSYTDPTPAEVLPGASLEIFISFTPIDDGVMSFVMGDLLITNDSTTTPNGLSYSILGNGEAGSDPCSPFTDCGGECVDLNSDLDNCGLCDNVCTAPDNATAVCEVGACDFICDEGYERVDDSCQFIVPQTLEEMIDALVEFVEDSVDEGTLVGLGPGRAGEARLNNFFIPNLERAQGDIHDGTPYDLEIACSRLNASQLRCDGGWPFIMPPDFVAGEARSEVYNRIIAIMELIEGCEPTEAPTRPIR
jgi:hypothetical protein